MHAWAALARVLSSVEAVRDGQAWYLLLTVFASGGILVAAAESAFAGSRWWEASIEAGLAFFVVFYGSNAAGIWTMQRARGETGHDVFDAVCASLLRGHRLILMVLMLAAVAAAGGALLWALLWVSKLRYVGPPIYALVVPVAVLSVGLAALAGVVVVVPLAAPAVWAGESPLQGVRVLWEIARQRLVMGALLVAAVSLVTGLTGALASFVVMVGGSVVAQLSVWITGVHVPAGLLMAGLFGHGLRSVDSTQIPPEALHHTFAALAGGGVVFALAVVVPGLVYLRGVCAVYLSLRESLLLPEAAREVDGSTPRAS
ncbi:hypothetical protein [Aquabacterium sp.]|uniref:hypothetical protein n=1 Tax=Aquabacterium sp. TaxID=1872578 RepID=UPI0035B37796